VGLGWVLWRRTGNPSRNILSVSRREAGRRRLVVSSLPKIAEIPTLPCDSDGAESNSAARLHGGTAGELNSSHSAVDVGMFREYTQQTVHVSDGMVCGASADQG